MKQYICTVCGYIHEGDTPPDICPICKVGAELFKELKVEENSNKEGWEGYRPFYVDKKVKENDVVTSFYLKPVEKCNLPIHTAGQFLSVKPIKEGIDRNEVRQYSLSMEPGKDYYRISVKREEHGKISRYMHDQVSVGDVIEITAPLGEFVLEENNKPVVLLSGGIGITPVMSMLYSSVKSGREILFVQAALNSTAHTFKSELKTLKGQYNNLKTAIFYQTPLEGETVPNDYDYEGFVSKEWIINSVPREADFYFCGPPGFMKHIYQCLKEVGVPDTAIHYEAFGPAIDLSK